MNKLLFIMFSNLFTVKYQLDQGCMCTTNAHTTQLYFKHFVSLMLIKKYLLLKPHLSNFAYTHITHNIYTNMSVYLYGPGF